MANANTATAPTTRCRRPDCHHALAEAYDSGWHDMYKEAVAALRTAPDPQTAADRLENYAKQYPEDPEAV